MITTYEIRNVLRVYGNQLKRRSTRLEENIGLPNNPLDFVDISIDARRRQMLNQMSNQLISQIAPLAYESKAEGMPIEEHLKSDLDGGAFDTEQRKEELI